RRATTSAWGPPGGWVAPSNTSPSGATITQPTHGLGEVVARTVAASSTARSMGSSGLIFLTCLQFLTARSRIPRDGLMLGGLLREEGQGVGQDVEHRVEAFDCARGRARRVEDDRPPAGAGGRPRQPSLVGV